MAKKKKQKTKIKKQIDTSVPTTLPQFLASADTPYPKVTSRVNKEDTFNASMVERYVMGINTVAPKIPLQIYDIVDNLCLMDPYVNKYHHTTIALGNSGHDINITAKSTSKAQAAVDLANSFADTCFPFGGGMPGLLSGCFSQLARTTATCVEWVPDRGRSRVKQGYLVPIKTIRFVYDKNGDYVLCQQQSDGVVPLNMAQTVYFNAMIRDNNPYAIPPIISAIEPCSTHRTIVEKISLWMDKLSALGVMIAEVVPPPRLPGESQEAYDSKSGSYLNALASSIRDNMASGLGVAYNNVKFQFQNTQAGAAGAKDLLQMVLQGLFAGLQRDPIMFGWNFGNSDAFVKVIYEELVQGLAFYQRGVAKVIEHGHRLNLALAGFGDCPVSVRFHASRSLDQFRDSEAEYMDSKKILEQLINLVISPDEARKQLGYDALGSSLTDVYTATFSAANNKYELLSKEKQIFSINNDLTIVGKNNYETDISTLLKKYNDNGIAAFSLWMALQGNLLEDVAVSEGLETYLKHAEKSLNDKEISNIAWENLERAWDEGKNNPDLFSRVGENKSTQKSRSDELAAIFFLAYIVEPYMVKNFLSRSEWRLERARNAIKGLFGEYNLDNPTPENLNAFQSALSGYMGTLAGEAAKAMSDVTESRGRMWGALYALRDSGVQKFMIMGPDDDRKCEFCRSLLYKVFSVETEISNINKTVLSKNPNISDEISFMTSRFAGKEGLDRLAGLSEEQIQESGVATPPYHVNCRDYVVAVS